MSVLNDNDLDALIAAMNEAGIDFNNAEAVKEFAAEYLQNNLENLKKSNPGIASVTSETIEQNKQNPVERTTEEKQVPVEESTTPEEVEEQVLTTEDPEEELKNPEDPFENGYSQDSIFGEPSLDSLPTTEETQTQPTETSMPDESEQVEEEVTASEPVISEEQEPEVAQPAEIRVVDEQPAVDTEKPSVMQAATFPAGLPEPKEDLGMVPYDTFPNSDETIDLNRLADPNLPAVFDGKNLNGPMPPFGDVDLPKSYPTFTAVPPAFEAPVALPETESLEVPSTDGPAPEQDESKKRLSRKERKEMRKANREESKRKAGKVIMIAANGLHGIISDTVETLGNERNR